MSRVPSIQHYNILNNQTLFSFVISFSFCGIWKIINLLKAAGTGLCRMVYYALLQASMTVGLFSTFHRSALLPVIRYFRAASLMYYAVDLLSQ